MNFVFNFCFGPQKILFYFEEAVTRRDTLDKKEDATISGGAHHFAYHL